MTWSDAFKVVSAAVISVCGGGGIVVALSGWLGKVWANRLMAAEAARHAQALEEVRARLTRENDQTLAAIRTEFDIFRERFLKTQHEKLLTYRLGADLITGLLAAFDRFGEGRMSAEEAGRIRDDFNRERMRAYAYLAMLAPQPVMDAFDAVVDYLFAVMEAPTKYDWKHLRALSLALLNRIREDVGLDKTPIEYRGPR